VKLEILVRNPTRSNEGCEVEIEFIKENDGDIEKYTGYAFGFESGSNKVLLKVSTGSYDKISCTKGEDIIDDEEVIKEKFLSYLQKTAHERVSREFVGIENGEDENEELSEPEPYDPEKIRVDTKIWSVYYVFEMMMSPEKDLDLSPDFQRNFVWVNPTQKSRLIESILLRIPLPVFYLAQDDRGIHHVVDGVQRLSVIRDYISNKFKLKNLEYLKDCEGCYFDKNGGKNLDQKYIRRIKQTQLYFNIIDPQTPVKVKFEIFKRINTGGMPLNHQEIRNCLANANVRSMLKRLTHSKEFLDATDGSVRSIRMEDQELIMRFLSFYYERIIKHKDFSYKGNMKAFLDDTLQVLNHESPDRLSQIEQAFLNSMRNSHYLFGVYAFRKCKREHLEQGARRQLINKSLFTTISVLLSTYPHEEIVKKNDVACLLHPFTDKLDNNPEFYSNLTIGTNEQKRMEKTFDIVKTLVKDNLRI